MGRPALVERSIARAHMAMAEAGYPLEPGDVYVEGDDLVIEYGDEPREVVGRAIDLALGRR